MTLNSAALTTRSFRTVLECVGSLKQTTFTTTTTTMEKPQIIAHVQKSLNFTLFDAKWIPCSAKCVVLGMNL